MMRTITIRRGTKDLFDQADLIDGELAFVKDTNELFIGNDGDKICLAHKQGDLEFVHGGLICKLYYKNCETTLDMQLETITNIEEILEICKEALSNKHYRLLERELFKKY